MAIDLHSDNSGGTPTSPRLSFSYDLSQSATVPVADLLRSHSSSSIDFNFCIHQNSDLHQASMADELFSNGKILPTPVKLTTETCRRTQSPPLPIAENENSRLLEDDERIRKQQCSKSKSFWGFKRSSSCDGGYCRSLWPINMLSRSNSMGSSTSSKLSSSNSSKEGFNQKYHRNFQKPSVSRKPPLMKSDYGYGNQCKITVNNGIRVSPVLNLGFGSLFCKKKNKN